MDRISNLLPTFRVTRPNFKAVVKAVKSPITRKIMFTLLMLVVFRLMANVPLPGVDPRTFRDAVGDSPFNNIFTVISGGNLDKPSLAALGVAPYINASIIMQLLSSVVPKLEELRKEGQSGRDRINQLTRLLTVPLAFIQSIMIYYILTNPQLTGGLASGVVGQLSEIELVAFIVSLTVGSIMLMWIGELITQYGLGNGASLIIAFGIIASIPSLVISEISGLATDWVAFLNGNLQSLTSQNFLLLYGVIVAVILMVLFTVFVNEALRKVEIRYARRFGSQSDVNNFLPLKLNQAGVMPVIFAQALITFPQIIGNFIVSVRDSGRLYDFAQSVANSNFFDFTSPEYLLVYSILIVGFSFFYTFVIVKPEELVENLQKSGAFIPGIRPGKTTLRYIIGIIIKLTIFGSAFLVIISITPNIVSLMSGTNQLTVLSGIGGTSILIIVGVFMDMYRKGRSLNSVENYDSFK